VADRALPDIRFAQVIITAAAALDDLDDGISARDAEARRVSSATRALAQVRQAFALIDKHDTPDVPQDIAEALVTARNHQLDALAAECETWLPARGRGAPRREDLDRLAAIVVGTHRDAPDSWSIAAGARAVAHLADRVWAEDDRTKARAIALHLWGNEYFREGDEERVHRLAARLEDKAQSMTRVKDQ